MSHLHPPFLSGITLPCPEIQKTNKNIKPPAAAAVKAEQEQEIHTDLTHSGLLLTQSHDDDAVGLADAALGPRRERRVRLVEDNTVDVLLLAEPAGQTVLVDALKDDV